MTMRRQIVIALVCAGMGGAGFACQSIGDDDDDSPVAGMDATGTGGTMGANTGGTMAMGTGGTTTGTGGTPAGGTGGGGAVGSADGCGSGLPVNTACPTIAPIDGACAPAGMCCQRASNSAKEKALGPDDMLVLEYRVQYSDTTNAPMTLGLLGSLTTTRFEQEQQSQLYRFELPRMGGALVAGKGKFTVGVGRYNCDGTYSFYDDASAPDVPMFNSDKTRWVPVTTEFDFDPAKTGVDALKFPFAANKNRELTYTPFTTTDTVTYDWELINQGFQLTKFDFGDASRECIGARDGKTWSAGGEYVVYTPNDPNDVQPIAPLMGQTYCELAAFGPLAKNAATEFFNCKTDKRCAPFAAPSTAADATPEQMAGCPWKKLPDSLCPSDDAEKALFGCHLGDETNVNMEMGYPAAADLHCTQEAPTVAQDPDMGVTTVGQCCDPLGVSTTLPACNSYRLVQSVVAAAAEITDAPMNGLQPKCD